MFQERTGGDPSPITGRRSCFLCPTCRGKEQNLLMEIRSGTVTALYLFDVAEQSELAALRAIRGGGASARLASRPSAPAYLQYQTPPLVVEAEHTGVQ